MRIRYVALLMLSVPPLVALLSTMILATLRRKQNMTECRFCGMQKVRPSWPGGIVERTCAHIGLIPYKCDGCLDRFYGWRSG